MHINKFISSLSLLPLAFELLFALDIVGIKSASGQEVLPCKNMIEGHGYRILPRLPAVNAEFTAVSKDLFDEFRLPKHSRVTVLRSEARMGNQYYSDAARDYLAANHGMVQLINEMRTELILASPNSKRDDVARAPFHVLLQKGAIFGPDFADRFHTHDRQLIGLCTVEGPTTLAKNVDTATIDQTDMWRCGDNLPGDIIRPSIEDLLILMNRNEETGSGLHRSPRERHDRFTVSVTIDLD